MCLRQGCYGAKDCLPRSLPRSIPRSVPRSVPSEPRSVPGGFILEPKTDSHAGPCDEPFVRPCEPGATRASRHSRPGIYSATRVNRLLTATKRGMVSPNTAPVHSGSVPGSVPGTLPECTGVVFGDIMPLLAAVRRPVARSMLNNRES